MCAFHARSATAGCGARAWTPRPYQEEVVSFLLARSRAGLLLEPGLGKTACVLAAAKILLQRDMVRRLLVVAPLRVCHLVWPSEIEEWADFAGVFRPVFLHGTNKEKLLAAAAEPGSTHNVLLLNHDGVRWFSERAPKILRGRAWPDMLVVDESTAFKHSQSQRFRALRKLLPRFDRRVILTGTPAPNGLEDLWGQIFILDQGAALGQYVTQYRNAYFEASGFGGYTYRLRDGAETTIHKRIAGLVVHHSAKECLRELPERVENRIVVQLPPASRRLYQQVERAFCVSLETGDIVARNAAAALSKLRQVASGAVYLDAALGEAPDETANQQRHTHVAHDAKLDALEELYDSLQGMPLLVVYEFRHELSRLRARWPGLPALEGPLRLDAEIVARWNRGELRMLAVHPRSAGHGLNLQRGGHHLVWLTPTWDLELYEQTCRRLHRSGQSGVTVVHHIVAADTLDTSVLLALQSKDKTQTRLLNAVHADAQRRQKKGEK